MFASFSIPGCDTFCHPDVGCEVDENEQIVCGNCSEDLMGNGTECHPGMYVLY